MHWHTHCVSHSAEKRMYLMAINIQGDFFELSITNFSTKKKIANQPITAAVPVNLVNKKGYDWLIGSFLCGTEIGEGQ